MYARVATAQIKPGKMDEALRIYRASQIPEFKAQKGFKEVRLLTDAKKGTAIAVSIWATEADAKAATTNVQKFKDVIAKAPTFEYFDLSVQA